MKRVTFVRVLLLAGVSIALAQSVKPAPEKGFGNPNAPVRIDLYSDYQCPSCKVLHEQTMAPLLRDYVRTGKVYLVRREFPLPMHAHAREAACLACAAQRIGKYELVCDQLFRTQDTWAAKGDVAGAACSVLSAADAKKLRTMAGSPEIAAEVEGDIRLGQGENVKATPTMIISRTVRRYPVSGPVSYTVLSKFLDSILN